MQEKRNLIIAGSIFGILAVGLVALGNPANMGFCIACFYRDIAGSLGLHSAAAVQYARPEIMGLILGSFVISTIKGEFKSRGGSSPFLRFIIAFFVMVGALVFLGCPFRMILRLAGGDLNALVGLFGFAAGIGVGGILLNRGFSLGRSYTQSRAEGTAFSAAALILVLIVLFLPMLLKASTSGPGSQHAPLLISLAAGLVVGSLAQRTRLCMAGGIRDLFLFKDPTLLFGSVAVLVVAFILNLATGSFKPGFTGQPIAHTQWLWNFLGMGLVGYGSVLLGGCPLRQTILAGEGNSDSAVTVLGFLAGAAVSHNFGLASSAQGATAAGKIATIVGFAVITLIAVAVMKKHRRS
ncbi:MAG: YedE family putative selenium transporter [Sphaerochaeta sp.]|jgi:YedE family putative selenium metabolism protein|uniref:YedE family putative selenium transporter n=1 Tax=Sphaerochaeta sp. TaxID=1972642 RepID=UPI000A4E5EC0|nr:YedE family putative selenium transporter [Sphaerochaeta sp.]MDX9825278.1 YedE family putative selenium transporter [Sphaerochaeta sp.]HPE94173.1 YedE family putative selenium transporter [Sphaerochaeta sp.]